MIVSLDYAWVGLVTYGISHLAHIWVWRNFLVRREVLLLIALTFSPLACYIAVLVIHSFSLVHLIPPMALHLVLSIHYIAIYPAFQASSPSIRILWLLSRSSSGLTRQGIVTRLTDSRSTEGLVHELSRSRLLRRNKTGWTPTRLGKNLAIAFEWYRRLLGLPIGDG